MAEIDRIIHAPARLRIMSTLIALSPQTQLDFRALGKALELTDGNLGAHLQTLEEAGVHQGREELRRPEAPHPPLGHDQRSAPVFEEHVAALREICRV